MTHRLTLIDAVERRVLSAPDSLTFDGCTLAQLRSNALRVASALRGRGLAGAPVLVAMPAGLDYVKCLLGCLYAGAIMVPAYPPTSTTTRLSRANQRIASILADAGVRCALVAGGSAGDALPVETLQIETLLAETPAPPEFTWWLDPDAVCLLQYTSGSTSSPKGVAVSLRQLTANLAAITDATQLSSSNVLVTWLPPYHDMGLIGGIFWPLFTGVATYVLSPESFIRRPRRWLAEISERRATVTMAPNFAFDLCVRRVSETDRAGLDLSSLRIVCNGAEPIQPETLEAFATAFAPHGFDRRAFFPCYGLAEATLFVAGGNPEAAPVVEALDATALERHQARRATSSDRVARIVSCGPVGTATSVRIVDSDSQMPVSEGQIGEVWVSGAAVATGYWNRPDATRGRFHARITGSDEGPFLRTGDLGFVLDDSLFITGRLSDLIVIRGQNHYPHDIERTVQAVHPAFRSESGAAFSVEVDGQERAVVVHEIDHRQQADAEALISEVLETVRQLHGLSLHACVIVKRGSVARTASGKVQRSAMKRAYLDGTLQLVTRWDASVRARERSSLQAEIAALDRDRSVTRTQPIGAARCEAITQFLRARVAHLARLEPSEIDEHAPLARYGVDSLHAAELTAALEEFLGEALPATLSYEQPTIAGLARALSAGPNLAPRPTDRREPVAPEAPAAQDAVAIVGMSCRFPGAPSLESFWDLLASGRDAVSTVPADRPQLASSGTQFGGFIENIDRFDPAFFEISAREAARMDPQQRLFLELTWAALEDAGIPASSLRETDAGVFAGVCANDYALLHAGQLSLIDADYGTGHAKSVVANRVSYSLDVRGPSMTVDTACSSALVALHLARESLLRRECSVAIVGGVNAVLAAEPGVFFAKSRALAKDGRCKTFDASADGFVRSEGCGVIVLKRLSDAEADGDRIYARVEGSATNHDGCSNGLMAPSVSAQERLLRAALKSANIAPDQIDYIEAHGVGTPVSDAVELGALGRVFARSDQSPCYVGSVKTNLGHLEAASGIAGVIKTALALSHERIPAHLHLRKVSSQVELERLGLAIPTRDVLWPRSSRTRFAGISAFGFGGTNAHVVLRERSTPRPEAQSSRRCELLALSAKDPAALREIAAGLLPRVSDLTLSSACFTLNTGRDHFAYRAAIVARDAAEMRAGLEQIVSAVTPARRRREPRIAFVFDERAPSAGVARELYDAEPVFRSALESGARVASSQLDADVLPALLSTDPSARLEFRQASGLVVQHALHALLEHWKVAPSIISGSGTGEFAAACAAGVLGWHDALRLVARRELLLASLVPGARVRQTLHQFKVALAAVDYAPPSLQLVAAGLGRLVGSDEKLGRDYWLSHLYAPANAERSLAALHRLEADGQLELAADSCSQLALLRALATFYEHGAALDFRAFHAGFEREKLALPGYAFQRQRCWLEHAAAAAKPEATPESAHPFLRTRVVESGRR